MEENEQGRNPAERVYAEFLEKGGIDFEALCAANQALQGELRRIHEQRQRFTSDAAGLDWCSEAKAPAQPDGSGLGDDLPPNFQDLLRKLRRKHQTSARYQLRGEVAHGGMGAILRIHDDELDRDLAMKVLLGQSPEYPGETPPVDSRLLARFLDGAQVTGQLDHPGVVPVSDPETRLSY